MRRLCLTIMCPADGPRRGRGVDATKPTEMAAPDSSGRPADWLVYHTELDLVVSLEKKPYRADAQTHAPAREVALAPRVDDEDDVRDRRVVEAPRRARERLGGSARRVDEEEQVPAMFESTECPLCSGGGFATHLHGMSTATAAPRLVSTDYRLLSRGSAATRLHGLSASQPRRRRDSSPQTIYVSAAAARDSSPRTMPRRRRCPL